MGAAEIYQQSGLLTLSDIEDATLLTRFVADRGHFQAAAAYCAHPRGRSYSDRIDRARAEALLEFIDLYEDPQEFARFLREDGPGALAEIQAVSTHHDATLLDKGPLPF